MHTLSFGECAANNADPTESTRVIIPLYTIPIENNYQKTESYCCSPDLLHVNWNLRTYCGWILINEGFGNEVAATSLKKTKQNKISHCFALGTWSACGSKPVLYKCKLLTMEAWRWWWGNKQPVPGRHQWLMIRCYWEAFGPDPLPDMLLRKYHRNVLGTFNLNM